MFRSHVLNRMYFMTSVAHDILFSFFAVPFPATFSVKLHGHTRSPDLPPEYLEVTTNLSGTVASDTPAPGVREAEQKRRPQHKSNVEICQRCRVPNNDGEHLKICSRCASIGRTVRYCSR